MSLLTCRKISAYLACLKMTYEAGSSLLLPAESVQLQFPRLAAWLDLSIFCSSNVPAPPPVRGVSFTEPGFTWSHGCFQRFTNIDVFGPRLGPPLPGFHHSLNRSIRRFIVFRPNLKISHRISAAEAPRTNHPSMSQKTDGSDCSVTLPGSLDGSIPESGVMGSCGSEDGPINPLIHASRRSRSGASQAARLGNAPIPAMINNIHINR